ncbi:MAG TPA: oligosaccharide flippase family protein [Bryobacteraceae bacterium]|nr:oligosaccharide flippase family protein [Bryobacteraceae bacterium]
MNTSPGCVVNSRTTVRDLFAHTTGAILRLLPSTGQMESAGKDVLVSAAPQAFGLLTGLLTSVLIARGLGPKGLGQYALATSVGSIVGMLSDLGINQTAIRFASNAAAALDTTRQFAVLRWAFHLRLGLILAFGTLGWIAAPALANTVWREPGISSLLRLGILSSAVGAMGAIPGVYFQSIRKFGHNAVVSILQKTLILAGILGIWATSSWRVDIVLWVSFASGLFGSVAFLSLIPRETVFRRQRLDPSGRGFWADPEPAIGTPWHFLRFHVLATLIAGFTSQLDVWALGRLLSTGELGVYVAAQRTTLPLTILLAGINTALWPRASQITDPVGIRRLLKYALGLCGLLALIAVPYAVFVPKLLPALFGKPYISSVRPGQILCLGYCLAMLVCPAGVIAYSVGYVRVAWLFNALQLAVEGAGLIVLIPRFGVSGAATTFLLQTFTGTTLALFYINARSKRKSTVQCSFPSAAVVKLAS